jgi:hypothetical protein
LPVKVPVGQQQEQQQQQQQQGLQMCRAQTSVHCCSSLRASSRARHSQFLPEIQRPWLLEVYPVSGLVAACSRLVVHHQLQQAHRSTAQHSTTQQLSRQWRRQEQGPQPMRRGWLRKTGVSLLPTALASSVQRPAAQLLHRCPSSSSNMRAQAPAQLHSLRQPQQP